MRADASFVLIPAVLCALGMPLCISLFGLIRSRYRQSVTPQPAAGWNWRLTLGSTLLYTLAFNLTFIVQEFFLVLPKALTPGLHPILYHNDHHWTGTNPLARLWQGSGALTILLMGFILLSRLGRRVTRSDTWTLFGIWLTYNALYQALPQVVVGAVLPQNDVGMAMDYLRLGPMARNSAAFVALLMMAVVAVRLTRLLLQCAPRQAQIDGARRARWILEVATVPAFAAIGPIVIFRMPGSLDQVLLVPVAVAVLGTVWLQASAWWVEPRPSSIATRSVSIRTPLILLGMMLLLFQLVLRRGIAF